MKDERLLFKLDGSGPLYRQIKRAITQPILLGRCGPGTRLPSEAVFTKVFRTSRMTVNRALQMLADEGLVVRHRRNGTFVAPQFVEHAVMELRDIVDEIEQTGATYGYELIERRKIKVDRIVAGRIGIRAGSAVLYVHCRHLSDGEPMLIEERYINMKAVPEAARESFADTPPGRWLLTNVPWSRAQHVIHAVNATAEIAALLKIRCGTACLRIERQTWHAELPITLVNLTYPGNRHRLIGRYAPGE